MKPCAVARSPRRALQRAQVLVGMDRREEAICDLNSVIGLVPEHAMAYYLRSFCWRKQREHARQLNDLEKVVELAPEWSEPCNSLAWLLATCPDPRFHDGPRAVEFGRRALEHATEPRKPECFDTLAAALARNGDFAEAIDRQCEAIALMEDVDRRIRYEKRLALYENGEPCVEEPDEWMPQ